MECVTSRTHGVSSRTQPTTYGYTGGVEILKSLVVIMSFTELVSEVRVVRTQVCR
jgi:hypothetical protein